MRTRALAAGICTIVVAILTGIIAPFYFEWLKDYLGLWSIAGLTAAALIAAVVQFWPEGKPERVEKEFEILWPQLSNLLLADTEKSANVARQFINLPSGDWPPSYERPKSAGIANNHRKLLKSYDPQLGSALKRYYAADAALRREASDYKRERETPGSHDALRRRAFDLEIASDELKGKVERRNDIT